VEVDMGVVMATDRSGPLLLSEAKGRIGARGVRVIRSCLPMIASDQHRTIAFQWHPFCCLFDAIRDL
jgi:hypothetical protein